MGKALPVLLAILILVSSAPAPAWAAQVSTSTISNLVPFTTPQLQALSTPSSGCFFGQTANQNTTQVNYTFKPNGIVYWSNSLGSNITISTLSIGGLPVQITQGLLNSTTYAYPFSTLQVTGNLYLSQLTNGCSTQSNQFSLKISGTALSQTTLTLNIGNPKSLPVKCDQNNLRYFVGSEGIDFHDAQSYTPSCTQTSITFNLPLGAFNIDPATIGTSNSNGNCGATGCDNQIKLWEANGYYFYFYTDNVHFGYRSCLVSSANCGTSSVNWGAFTNLTGQAAVGDCSSIVNATVSSSYLWWACSTSGQSFTYQAGHLTVSGTFAGSFNVRTVTTLQTSTGYAFILENTNTSIFVSVKSYDGTNEHIEVWSCSSACGTPANFANKLDENDVFGNNDAHPSLAISRVSGTTYLEVTWGYDGYSINHALSIRYSTNYGSTWSSTINSACNIDAMGYSQVTQTNGTLYIIAVQSGAAGCTAGKDDYIRWDFGSASITYETKNAFPGGGGFDGVGISSNGAGSVSVVFETGSTTIVYQASTNGGNTFGGTNTISSAENFGSLDFTPTISISCDASNNVLVGWSSGAGTPFNVRFALYTGCTAATVTQAIQITTLPAGATSATIGVTGCAVSNSTFTANGNSHTYTLTSSCTVSLANPSPGLHSRYCWNISPHPTCSTGTITFSTCGTGTCTTYSNNTYYQPAQNWTLTPTGTWDAIYATKIIGTFLGSASHSTNCANTAAGGGAVTCTNIYFDYNTQSCAGTPIGNTWNAVAPNCFTDTTANNVHTVNYIQSTGNSSSTGLYLWELAIPFALIGIVLLSKRRRLRI